MIEQWDASACQGDHRPQRQKRRFVLFSAKDEAIFSEALRQAFPTIKYLVYSDSRNPPASLNAFDVLTEVPGAHVHIVVPRKPNWQRIPSFDPNDDGWAGFANFRVNASLLYYRSVWDWSFYNSERISYDVPTINHGEIFGSYKPRLANLILVHAVWKIIRRIA